MNEVATQQGGAVAAFGQLKAGLSNVKATLPTPGNIPIMRMGRDGYWIYGPDNIEDDEGAEWAFSPMSLQHGFVCFDSDNSAGNGKFLGEVLVSMFEPLPDKSKLQQTGFPWQDCINIAMHCVSGTDKGTDAVYKPSSYGGLQAARELIDAIIARVDAGEKAIVPVCVLESDHYQHKTWGKTYTPVLRIVRWVDMEGNEFAAAAGGPAAAAAPAEQQESSEQQAAETASEPAAQTAEPAQEQPAEQSGSRRRRRGGGNPDADQTAAQEAPAEAPAATAEAEGGQPARTRRRRR